MPIFCNILPTLISNSYLFVMEAENSLKDENVGAVHGNGLLLAAVRHKVVDRHVHLLALLQPLC